MTQKLHHLTDTGSQWTCLLDAFGCCLDAKIDCLSKNWDVFLFFFCGDNGDRSIHLCKSLREWNRQWPHSPGRPVTADPLIQGTHQMLFKTSVYIGNVRMQSVRID